jgi:SAM-dependent methyltransferase
MRPRILLGRSLISAGRFIQSLAVVVMKPRDLVEFTRRTYACPSDIEDWSRADLVDLGLNPDEKMLFEALPVRRGKTLVFGVGGGRVAIDLARRGFEVTGADFVPDMVEKTVANARDRGLSIEGVVQDLTTAELPSRAFDVIWLTPGLYSLVPTRKLRLRTLGRLRSSLTAQGFLVCGFYWDPDARRPSRGDIPRGVAKLLTLGNFGHQKGDVLLANIEFVHAFSSRGELEREFVVAGFETLSLNLPAGRGRGGAVLKARNA